MIIITDVELTTNNISHADADIADSSGTTNSGDFTEKAIITPSSSDSKTSSAKKFDVTSTIADDTTVTTSIPESSISTLQASKRVIPLSKDNYTVKCFEKVCTTVPPKNLGKMFSLNLYLFYCSNFGQ